MLDAGDGHRVYWECCGNPNGKPVLYVHGGPGAGCTPGARRFFDPELHGAVLFDQRGCGRSTPLASDAHAALSANTTQHLIRDMEQLREMLHIDRWTVFGGSWGTTLALAYAQAFPRRVEALVLMLVTTTSRAEVHWITEGIGMLFPREWERFANAIPERLRGRPLVDAYSELLFDDDPAVRELAAREWCAWEDTHVSLAPDHRPNPRFDDPAFRLGFARLVTHYWKNAAFLEDEQLIRNAGVLNGIPGEMIHGRYDVSSPLQTAWRISKAWTSSTLRVIDDAGHGGGSIAQTAVEALQRLAGDRAE